MILYKDKNSDAEIFTDSYKFKTVKEVIYEVEGKTVINKFDCNSVNTGANASAEEASEDTEETVERGPDFAFACRLHKLEVPYSKADFKVYFKKFLKSVAFPADKEKVYQTSLGEYFKEVWKTFKTFDQYIGEGLNVEDPTDKPIMICLVNYRQETDEPYMICVKHGLLEEKQ